MAGVGSSFAVTVAAAVAVASVVACNARPLPDPDGVPSEVRAFARARCPTLETCACESDSYRDRAECEDDVVALYLEHLDGDPTLDLACFESAARSWRKDLCGDPIFDEPCDVVEPTRQRGEWCPDRNLFADPFARVPWCAPDLACWSGACVDGAEPRQEGDPCSPDGLCGPVDLVCFQGRCEPPHLEGEPCESPATCAHAPIAALYCTDGSCVPKLGDGEGCQFSGECESLACVGGRCIVPPALVCLSAETHE